MLAENEHEIILMTFFNFTSRVLCLSTNNTSYAFPFFAQNSRGPKNLETFKGIKIIVKILMFSDHFAAKRTICNWIKFVSKS